MSITRVTPRQFEQLHRDVSRSQIAEMTGVSLSTANSWFMSTPRKWSLQVEIILGMYAELKKYENLNG